MKTPMQELIAEIKRLKYSEINEQAWDAYDSVMDVAESLLEKEKEVMREFADNYQQISHQKSVDDHFEETFNSEEK